MSTHQEMLHQTNQHLWCIYHYECAKCR